MYLLGLELGIRGQGLELGFALRIVLGQRILEDEFVGTFGVLQVRVRFSVSCSFKFQGKVSNMMSISVSVSVGLVLGRWINEVFVLVLGLGFVFMLILGLALRLFGLAVVLG